MRNNKQNRRLSTERIRWLMTLVILFFWMSYVRHPPAIATWDAPLATHGKPNRILAPQPPPHFVFLVGIEGSGHHLWQSLIEQSPLYKSMDQEGLQSARELSYQLFDKLHLEKSLFGYPCSDDWNGTALVEVTATKLRALAAGTGTKKNKTTIRAPIAPLNGLPGTNRNSGMMSYPNYSRKDHCGPLKFPNINLLQQACRTADVRCGMLVQYRHPLSVIRSTTKNRKQHSLGFAIQLYIAMLDVIRGQLQSFAEDDPVICWNYNDNVPPPSIGNWLGYAAQQELFEQEFAKIYRSSPIPAEEDVIPVELRPLMSALYQAHERLEQQCGALTGSSIHT